MNSKALDVPLRYIVLPYFMNKVYCPLDGDSRAESRMLSLTASLRDFC